MSTISSVITGDIIGSTHIKGDFKGVLHQIAEDIRQYVDDRFMIDIYRGDSFQTISNKPEQAFQILIMMKAGLRQHSSKQGKTDVQWDARMSLGIGAMEAYPQSAGLSELSGEPFTRSGRALDKVKEKGSLLHITTGDATLDTAFEATCPLIEVITNRWNTTQAQAVYHSLLRNFTQQQLGELFKITQRAAGKRLDSSNLEAIRGYDRYFQQLIKAKWKI
ncbi:MAG: SatD family protein [Cyclobacteriaceae bacterium]